MIEPTNRAGRRPRPLRVAGWLLAFALIAMRAAPAHAGGVLESVRQAGTLACGVIGYEQDYTKQDTHGDLSALGADICRAVAAAVLGPGHVRITEYPDARHGMQAIAGGTIALLVGPTPDVTNQAVWKLAFGPPVFLDGQGFLVARDSGIRSVADLAGRQVCFIADTEAETMLDVALARRGIAIKPFPFEEVGEMEAALVDGHCAAMTADISMLAGARAEFHARMSRFVILPESITLDPMAPAYRQGDPQWAAIVLWVEQALLQAEALGVTQQTVAAMRDGHDPVVRRLLGSDPGIGRLLGLPDDWAARAISAVGNYGEVYARDVGRASPLDLPRGPNALWTQGGLLYPLPVR
ncbi:MAG TPA: transporter substrate-binding domain-containing protein [Acetobacteraceae bacterium]|nr:transporter substrate-binding domain-containing protein [Acetobacteraceae bacterium]